MIFYMTKVKHKTRLCPEETHKASNFTRNLLISSKIFCLIVHTSGKLSVATCYVENHLIGNFIAQMDSDPEQVCT